MLLTPAASTSSQLTLAMPTELAFNSVMPWFVLSPRSHMPKSCEPGTVSEHTQQAFESHPSMVLPEGAGVARGNPQLFLDISPVSPPLEHTPLPQHMLRTAVL